MHLVLLVAIVGASASPGSAQRSGAIALDAGQVLTFFTSAPNEHANAARARYFDAVLPMAEDFGFVSVTSLRIEGSRFMGTEDFGPSPTVSLFSWPSVEDQRAFDDHVPFQEWKSMRPDLWVELREASMVLEEPVALSFDPSRLYRVVFLWENGERPHDFARYQAALAETVAEQGGRYIVRGEGVAFHSLVDNDVRPPEHVWIIEWPSRNAHRAYQESDESQANLPLFMSGVERFEVHEVRYDRAEGGR